MPGEADLVVARLFARRRFRPFAGVFAIVEGFDLLQFFECFFDRAARVVELALQIRRRSSEIVAAHHRSARIGRIGEMGGVADFRLLLLILNLPLIGLWVRLLRIPYGVLFPIVILFCVVGAYSINSSYVDVLVMAIFGLLGVWFRRLDYPLVPLVFAFVLGPTLELSLNQLLIVGGQDYLFIFTRPVAATAFVLAILLAISGLVASGKRFRQGVLESGGEV